MPKSNRSAEFRRGIGSAGELTTALRIAKALGSPSLDRVRAMHWRVTH